MQSLPAVSETSFLAEDSSKLKGKRNGDGVGRLGRGAMLRYTYRTEAEEGKVSSEEEEGEEDDEDEEEEDSSSSEEEDEETDDDDEEYSVSGSSEEEEAGGEAKAMNLRDGKETLFLPSGKIVGRKSGERESRRTTTRRAKAKEQSLKPSEFEDANATTSNTTSATEPGTSNDLIPSSSSHSHSKKKQSRALAERHAAGLVGLSDKQRSVLAREEKKMMSLEGRERGGFAESVDRKGNSQKHYRIGGSRGGKKMGGLEKRLG